MSGRAAPALATIAVPMTAAYQFGPRWRTEGAVPGVSGQVVVGLREGACVSGAMQEASPVRAALTRGVVSMRA
ncbi:hypothetical protein GCM10010211_51000 [Streptomyces albospinus]|uniref:Uncharacterized protein n=1 Tax=Streptomyces albospinus TaxID=285515 RepID=A0ABQ2VC41_9ACTN|nr:hypothetical protein GCM10010211_51000 [Streptomyces albospinus]